MFAIRLTFLTLAAALLLLSLTAAAQAETEYAKPTVVKIHANWCGTCARLEKTWETLKENYGDSAKFVVFDVTDKAALEQSRTEAKQLGLTSILDKFKASTGTIAVIGADGVTLNVFNGVSDPDRYDDALGLACSS